MLVKNESTKQAEDKDVFHNFSGSDETSFTYYGVFTETFRHNTNEDNALWVLTNGEVSK